MKSIVIFLQNRNFFGAQIVHLPLIKALKVKYPDYQIILFSKYPIAKVLEPFVNEVFIETSRWKSFQKYRSMNPNISINLRKRSWLINGYITLFNTHKKIGFCSWLTKRFFDQCTQHDTQIYRAQNYLNLIHESLIYEEHKKHTRIAIIPGAGEQFKTYPIAKFIELATKLKKRYPENEIVFILGKNEKHMQENIGSKFKIYYELDALALFEVIQNSKLIIANDCGPSHIAQISNSANIILYSNEKQNAHSVIKEWFNPKENAKYLLSDQGKKIDSIEVKSIFNTTTKLLDQYSFAAKTEA